MASSSSSNPPPPPTDQPPAPTKGPFQLLGIGEKGEDQGYGCMRDEFRADPETGDLICNTCRPQFRFKWAQMKPEEGKQRQFNKGNLKTHIKANNIHTDLSGGPDLSQPTDPQRPYDV
jgi:hypothetical protein